MKICFSSTTDLDHHETPLKRWRKEKKPVRMQKKVMQPSKQEGLWLHLWNSSPSVWGLGLSLLMETPPWVNPQVVLHVVMNENFMYNILKNRTMWIPPQRYTRRHQLTCGIVLERRVSGYLGRTYKDRLCCKARETPAAGGGVGCPALLLQRWLRWPWRAGSFSTGRRALCATGQCAIRHRGQHPLLSTRRRGWTVHRIGDGAGHPLLSTRAA